MCKSKKMSTQVIEPKTMASQSPKPLSSNRISETSGSHSSSEKISEPSRSHASSKKISGPSRSYPSSFEPSTSVNYTATGSSYNVQDSWISSVSSRTSLSSLRETLSENPHIYDFSEISSATNNFLAKRYSSSSSSASWRCTIRGNDVIVFQRKFRRQIEVSELRERLLSICKSHHTSLVKLKGASISGNYIYLVYDYVFGANLSDCLRNPQNPNFTVLSNWMSRIQIAIDISHGLDYIHNSTGLNLNFVHNHIKSSSIIVTEPSLKAKICDFGTSELCGEIVRNEEAEMAKDSPRSGTKRLGVKRSDSRELKFEGTRGYMSPEFLTSGVATQKSDVFAFGIVILELLSGQEPLKYKFDDMGGGYTRVSLIDTVREVVEGGEGGGVRRWVDKRLKDSYPVEVAEKMARVGLECVGDDPDRRPDMGRVQGQISKLYSESKNWADKMGVPTDFSVSLAPR
ncbi:unnamed protein product [Ilex paraguariensis]|uniref:Protein kinase domain-containing protein n=1 Tax=Ilex paraguariensis TaxID=185542 RepID=A0ABC8S7B3_9AQUA